MYSKLACIYDAAHTSVCGVSSMAVVLGALFVFEASNKQQFRLKNLV